MESSEISGKSIALWVGAALIITVVLIGVFKLASPGSGTTVDPNAIVKDLPPIAADDHVSGPANAPATLIEYSDFQCPACGYYFPMVEQVVSEHAQSLRYVYRHFPLSQHLQAKPAAYAAEAAAKQGKFWEMYRLLFQNQSDWAEKSTAPQTFESYATRLGLNLIQFRADSASTEVKDRVDRDYAAGINIDINSTPTFFLNGRRLQNPSSYEQFKQLIDAAIATSS